MIGYPKNEDPKYSPRRFNHSLLVAPLAVVALLFAVGISIKHEAQLADQREKARVSNYDKAMEHLRTINEGIHRLQIDEELLHSTIRRQQEEIARLKQNLLDRANSKQVDRRRKPDVLYR